MKMLVKDSLSIASIFILFLLSFYQRQPHITNQTDASDVANLQILTTLDIWDQSSPTQYSFLPVQSYQNVGDKNIHYYQRFNDKNGNNYYVSYPPLCYILPYFLHTLGFELNRSLLVWLNIVLHLISALFLYFLMKNMLKFNAFSWNITSSLAYFILVPVMTYSFTRMYFAETLCLCLFIASVYFLYQLIFSNPKSKLYLLGFILSFALLSYCEWTSVFLFICLSGYLYFAKKLDKKIRLKLFSTALLCLLIPLLLFLIQILTLNSFSEGFHSLSIRLLERSGWFGQKYSSDGVSIFDFQSILKYFILLAKTIGIIGFFMILFVLITRFTHSKKIKLENKAPYIFILVLIFFPILIHNIVFFNANALHYHLQIKWIFLISLIWSLASSKTLINIRLNTVFQIVIILVLLFIQIYTPRFKAVNNEYLNSIAQKINSQNDSNSALFANLKSEPQTPFNLAYLSFLTKRNFAFATDTIQAKQEALKLNHKSATFISGEQSENSSEIIKLDIK